MSSPLSGTTTWGRGGHVWHPPPRPAGPRSSMRRSSGRSQTRLARYDPCATCPVDGQGAASPTIGIEHWVLACSISTPPCPVQVEVVLSNSGADTSSSTAPCFFTATCGSPPSNATTTADAVSQFADRPPHLKHLGSGRPLRGTSTSSCQSGCSRPGGQSGPSQYDRSPGLPPGTSPVSNACGPTSMNTVGTIPKHRPPKPPAHATSVSSTAYPGGPSSACALKAPADPAVMWVIPQRNNRLARTTPVQAVRNQRLHLLRQTCTPDLNSRGRTTNFHSSDDSWVDCCLSPNVFWVTSPVNALPARLRLNRWLAGKRGSLWNDAPRDMATSAGEGKRSTVLCKEALTKNPVSSLVELLAEGGAPPSLGPFPAGVSLTALPKNDVGLRPIAEGARW